MQILGGVHTSWKLQLITSSLLAHAALRRRGYGPGGRGLGTALAGAELIEQRGGAIARREPLSRQGARLVALVGVASGEFLRGRQTAVGGRGS